MWAIGVYFDVQSLITGLRVWGQYRRLLGVDRSFK